MQSSSPLSKKRDTIIATPPKGFVPRSDEQLIVSQLFRPYFQTDRENFLVAGFERFGRLVCMARDESNSAGHVCISAQAIRFLLSHPTFATAIAVHNHPSQDTTPSANDFRVTKEISSLFSLAGVHLADHIIIVDHGHFSFQAAGLL